MTLSRKEQEILEDLRTLRYDKRRLKVLYGRLKEITYKLTPTLSLSGGGGGRPSNQIESLCVRRDEVKREINEIRTKAAMYEAAILTGGLTDRERDVIDAVITGHILTKYAQDSGIYRSNVYKIRDKALKKISRELP